MESPDKEWAEIITKEQPVKETKFPVSLTLLPGFGNKARKVLSGKTLQKKYRLQRLPKEKGVDSLGCLMAVHPHLYSFSLENDCNSII